MSNYLPVLLVSVAAGAPDDASFQPLPRGQVDYLSHNWEEEDVWRSWRNMTKQKNEIANGVRLENASWRTWWKQRNKLKTISPETLNWLKDSDVTWLYGPLHTAVDWTPPKPAPQLVPQSGQKPGNASLSSPPSSTLLNNLPSQHGRLESHRPITKPILKHRTISEMLTTALPASPLFNVPDEEEPAEDHDGYNEASLEEDQQQSGSGLSNVSNKNVAIRPSLLHTKSDTTVLKRRGAAASSGIEAHVHKKPSPPRMVAQSGEGTSEHGDSASSALRPGLKPSRTSSSTNLAALAGQSYSSGRSSVGLYPHQKGRGSGARSGSSDTNGSSSSRSGDVAVTPGNRSSDREGAPSKRHISFNTYVEQYIAIDKPTDWSRTRLRSPKARFDGMDEPEDGIYEYSYGVDPDLYEDELDNTPYGRSSGRSVFPSPYEDDDEDDILEMRPSSRRSSISSDFSRQTISGQGAFSVVDDREDNRSSSSRRQSNSGSRSASNSTAERDPGRDFQIYSPGPKEHMTIAPIAPTMLKAGGDESSSGFVYGDSHGEDSDTTIYGSRNPFGSKYGSSMGQMPADVEEDDGGCELVYQPVQSLYAGARLLSPPMASSPMADPAALDDVDGHLEYFDARTPTGSSWVEPNIPTTSTSLSPRPEYSRRSSDQIRGTGRSPDSSSGSRTRSSKDRERYDPDERIGRSRESPSGRSIRGESIDSQNPDVVVTPPDVSSGRQSRGRSLYSSNSGTRLGAESYSPSSSTANEGRSESRGRSRTRGSSASDIEQGRSRSSGGANSPLGSISPSSSRPSVSHGLGNGGSSWMGHSGREIRDGRGVGLYRKTSEDFLGRRREVRESTGQREKRVAESLSPPGAASPGPSARERGVASSPLVNSLQLNKPDGGYRPYQVRTFGYGSREGSAEGKKIQTDSPPSHLETQAGGTTLNMIEEEQSSPSQASHRAPVNIPRAVKPTSDNRNGKTVTSSTIVPNSTLKSNAMVKSKSSDEAATTVTDVQPNAPGIAFGGHNRTRSVGSTSSTSTTSTLKTSPIDVTNVTSSFTANSSSSQQHPPDSPSGTGGSLAGRAADIVSSARDFLGAIWS